MNRPRAATFFFGHSAVTLTVLVIGGLLIYQWWQGHGSDIVPVGAVLAMIAAANANRQVTEYKNWKRAWDALGGARATRSKTHWGIYICTPIWMLTGAIIFSLDHDHPDRAVAIVCFAVVSTCLFIWIWYRDYRQKNPSRARPRKEALVAISLSVPRKSPGAKDIYKGLPGYCTRLNQG